MKKLNAAIAELTLLRAEGYNPKLLWSIGLQDYSVVYIWYPDQSRFYDKLI